MRWSGLGLLSILALVGCGATSGATPLDGGADSADVGDDVGGDGATDAPASPADDPHFADRASCKFTAGAKVTDTLPITAAQRAAIPLKHIIVLMKENRSFDHILGEIHDHGQPQTEAIPKTFSNVDGAGATVAPFRLTTTCVSHDPDHQWGAMHTQVNDGAMDGFVASAAKSTGTDGHFAMGHYAQADLPFYYWMASTFALEDRHFPSVRSGTFPNRNFLLLGTADGVLATGDGFPNPGTPTLFDALDKASVSWGVYSDGSLLSGTLNWDYTHKGAHHFADFLDAVDKGTLPSVAFVDGIDDVEDEHPTANVQVGEAWTREVYERVVASPIWASTAMVWTYDEAGGFADHVPPPNQACQARPLPLDTRFVELGVRVPLVVVSPWAKPAHVSHVTEDHTAITRLVEAVFDLPALTARDANSTALLDMFDFSASAPPLGTPPAAPAAGTGGCVGGLVMTSAKPNYASGEAIKLTFNNAPGTDPTDWIVVMPYPATGPTPPGAGYLLSRYVGGAATPSTSPKSGTVTLDSSAAKSPSAWPLTKGGYIAYYLVHGGYTQLASIDFNVE